MTHLTIIADDLTGAADAAAPFAVAGYATYVALDHDDLPDADVLALSTESRHIPLDDAVDRVRSAARVAVAPMIFKKIDSTLRGHPVAELHAVQMELQRLKTLIAPAFPAHGRTTVGGRQLLAGKPLEETPFREEIAGSDLLELFPGADLIDLQTVWDGEGAVRRLLQGTTARTWLADAETDEDLSVLCAAAVSAGVDLLCGSGGLARVLSQQRLFTPRRFPPTGSIRQGGVLVVAGSRHPATLAQLTELRKRGALVCQPNQTNEAAEGLRQGRAVAIGTHDWRGVAGDGRSLASEVAVAVREVVDAAPAAGLVVTGGDVAWAVCRELGARGLWLDGEALPGMPLGRLHGGDHDGLRIGTKAGGFGQPDALELLQMTVAQSLEGES